MNIIIWKKELINKPELMVDNEDLFGCYSFNDVKQQFELLNSLNYKGYSNWRLPNKEELNELYEMKNIIGGFASDYYWSSSEYGSLNAWFQLFTNGDRSYFYKYISARVRAVRNIY